LPEAALHLVGEALEEGGGERAAVLEGARLGEAERRLGLVAEAGEQRLGPLHVGGEAEDREAVAAVAAPGAVPGAAGVDGQTLGQVDLAPTVGAGHHPGAVDDDLRLL